MFNKKGDKNPDDDDGMADMEDDMEVSEAERKELAKRRRKAEEEVRRHGLGDINVRLRSACV